MELKNILARQPGPEVAEQLSIYQANLREKTKQMKAMASELNLYQAQVCARTCMTTRACFARTSAWPGCPHVRACVWGGAGGGVSHKTHPTHTHPTHTRLAPPPPATPCPLPAPLVERVRACNTRPPTCLHP